MGAGPAGAVKSHGIPAGFPEESHGTPWGFPESPAGVGPRTSYLSGGTDHDCGNFEGPGVIVQPTAGPTILPLLQYSLLTAQRARAFSCMTAINM